MDNNELRNSAGNEPFLQTTSLVRGKVSGQQPIIFKVKLSRACKANLKTRYLAGNFFFLVPHVPSTRELTQLRPSCMLTQLWL